MAHPDRDVFTRQIRDAVDVVELVGGYVTLKRAGANLKGLCPFHEEKSPSFLVHPAKQIFKCFGCGAGGDVFKFIQLKERVDFPEARRILADRAGISLEDERATGGAGPRKTDLARANQWAHGAFRRHYQSPAGEQARAYVGSRGISPDMAEAFGIGLAVNSFDSLIREAGQARIDVGLLVAAGLAKESSKGGYYDTFRNRLMFPIRDIGERIVGFGGRALGDDPAKYLNTPATALFDKSTHLFGLDRGRQSVVDTGRAVLVEGYTDVIMAHQFGFTEAVATLGTAMTEAHAAQLRRYTDRVVLLFDSDTAGEQAADRALSVCLTGGLEVVLARVPEGKDPCDYLLSAGREAFEAVLKQAIPALQFKWRRVAQEYDASATGPGRRRALNAYLEQLAAWLRSGAIDPIQMGLLLNQVSKIVSLPGEELHRQLRDMMRRRGAAPARANGEPGSSRPTPPAGGISAEQSALREIMEVLLNEPEHYPTVAAYLDPDALHDPALSSVLKELVSILDADQPFRLDELIGRFDSPAYGRLITDLQARGERRGNAAAAVGGAVACLDAFQRTRRAAGAAAEITRQPPTPGDARDPAGDQDERLRELAASARNPQFSHTRAVRRFLS